MPEKTKITDKLRKSVQDYMNAVRALERKQKTIEKSQTEALKAANIVDDRKKTVEKCCRGLDGLDLIAKVGAGRNRKTLLLSRSSTGKFSIRNVKEIKL
jgi:hypothetical protein